MRSETDSPTTATPSVLTVEEAAAVLRIGRNAAYALARRWRETDGREGLPVITLGRTLRVPAAALQEMLDHRTPPSHAPGAPTLDERPGAIKTSRRT